MSSFLRWPGGNLSALKLSPALRPIALGALALLLALGIVAVWMPAEQRELASLREAAATRALLLARQAAQNPAARGPVSTPDVRFRTAFPPLESRPQRIGSLLAAASAQRIVWSHSEFRAGADVVPGLARYQVTLPVAGSYAAIRRFVDAALRGDPALALERLELRRSGAGTTQVEALTVWSLYTRAEGFAGGEGGALSAVAANSRGRR